MSADERAASQQAADGGRRDFEARLRGVAHDINGALNTLALNLELLDRATATARDAGEEESPEVVRERCLASLRRATDQIQRIVSQQLLPLVGGSAGRPPGAR